MVTSVLPMMMMMTIFALSLVEIVQPRVKCDKHPDAYCPDHSFCVWDVNIYENMFCCPEGSKAYGTAGCCSSKDTYLYQSGGCCPHGAEVFQHGGCCPSGSDMWQTDDRAIVCCPKGKVCPRTTKHHPEPNYPSAPLGSEPLQLILHNNPYE